MIRARIVDTLSARLHARVTVGQIHIFYDHKLRMEVRDIRAVPIDAPEGAPPMLTVGSLRGTASLLNLLSKKTDLSTVSVNGLTVDLSASNRHLLENTAQTTVAGGSLPFTRVKVTDATLLLEPESPGKPAIVVRCSELLLHDVNDLKQPVSYDAILTAPFADLHVSGRLGPINLSNLRETAIVGSYSFDHVQLSRIDGLAGSVSAQGTLAGTFGQIMIAGSAQSPDFALDVSAHSFPARAEYRAIFDLRSGDIALPELTVRFLRTSMQVAGTIVRQGRGHCLAAELHIRDGRNEDLLTLLTQSRPLLDSRIQLDAHVDLPAGEQRFILRLRTAGKAALSDATWTSARLQQQMNDISMRASDHARRAEESPEPLPVTRSTVTGSFRLRNASLYISTLR